MTQTARLELRQGQKLVMTPQLQQAIRLLQLSNLELSAFIDGEVEQNPLLERDESGEPPVFRSALPKDAAGGAVRSSAAGAGRERAGADTDPATFSVAAVSLKDHLTQQMQVMLKDPVERLIASCLIDLVDEAGYLSADFGELGEQLGAPSALIEKVLTVLQDCDPSGVLARSLAECLALQLKDRNRYDPQIAALLGHLPLLAAHKLTELKRAVGVDADELADMIAEIKRLDPKPGLKFGAADVRSVVPDVLVHTAAGGGWRVELNDETLPRVLIDRGSYIRMVGKAHKAADKDYLNACLQTANWLIGSLDRRARTILRVAHEIVRRQDAFLRYGVAHLRPSTLKDVAEATGLHESTVSRVTSNKYMATPRGVFQMKYVFTTAIASADPGQTHSSEAVRHRIKRLIDAETAKTVLSDDKIVQRLRAESIDIARRTVAKYREAMGFASSAQRRRKIGAQDAVDPRSE